jgi:serine/threonine protein kinase
MAKTTTILEKHGWKHVGDIGKGGQAAVLEVRRIGDSPEAPSYALKVLRGEEGTQPYERFHREVQSLQKLTHPGIVKVVDHQSDPEEDLHFYVMEYIEGAIPLKKLVKSSNNPFYRKALDSLDVYIQILDALEACQQANIVHRDLSLGNILFDRSAGPPS